MSYKAWAVAQSSMNSKDLQDSAAVNLRQISNILLIIYYEDDDYDEDDL